MQHQIIMNMQTNDLFELSVDDKINKLEESVSSLLALCEKLTEENHNFKNGNDQLMLERSDLQNKNNKVKLQVEAMVDRLRSLDKAS